MNEQINKCNIFQVQESLHKSVLQNIYEKWNENMIAFVHKKWKSGHIQSLQKSPKFRIQKPCEDFKNFSPPKFQFHFSGDVLK